MRPTLAGAAILAVLAAPPGARADGVTDNCRARGASGEVCACASRALAGEVGIDDYALYHRLGWDYTRLRERGAAEGEAWESAPRAEIARGGGDPAVIRHRAKGLARAHRALIHHCHARLG